MDKTQLTMNFYWSIYYLFWCVLTRRNYKTLRVSNLVDKYCREKGWCVFYIKNIHCVQRYFYLYRKINLNILFLFVKKIKCYRSSFRILAFLDSASMYSFVVHCFDFLMHMLVKLWSSLNFKKHFYKSRTCIHNQPPPPSMLYVMLLLIHWFTLMAKLMKKKGICCWLWWCSKYLLNIDVGLKELDGRGHF